MRRLVVWLLFLFISVSLSACGPITPTETPSLTPEPLATTAVPVAEGPTEDTAVPSPSPTEPAPSPMPTTTPLPTLSPSDTPSLTPTTMSTPTETSVPTASPSPPPSSTPTATASAVPWPIPEATPGESETAWQVRTLLVGPGEPGPLYALLTEPSSGTHPAERIHFLVSEDYGETWNPFRGGLPAAKCVRNVNLDYGAPEALYASTCQGLYRWTGSEWVHLSPQETGMVAAVYGQPETIWAANVFRADPAVIRSDDGGETWAPAASGLTHFNGVANLGIDPRDPNTLYAVIWPKYAGSYLRRGTSDGQWQTMPTPRDNAQIDVGMTIDGATGALYVTAFTATWQVSRSLNANAPDVEGVAWEAVHDFGEDVAWATLLASGWSPEGLALYANLTPWIDRSTGATGTPVLHRSLDGGQSWSPLKVP